MADLIDRMTFNQGITGRPKINNHAFTGWMTLYAFGLVSRQDIVNAWDLQGDEVIQAGLLADEVDSRTGDAKVTYCLRVDGIAMLLDSKSSRYVTGETINKTLVIADLGI